MGRIVIETNPETGMDHVELTLNNGQTWIFHGQGDSELRHVRPEPEMLDVSTADGFREYTPGRREPDYWTFSVNIDKIPGVIVNEPEADGDGDGPDVEE